MVEMRDRYFERQRGGDFDYMKILLTEDESAEESSTDEEDNAEELERRQQREKESHSKSLIGKIESLQDKSDATLKKFGL